MSYRDTSNSTGHVISTRPPLTDHEAAAVRQLAETISVAENFHVSGILPDNVLPAHPTLLYIAEVEGQECARLIRLTKPDEEALERMHSEAAPSHFGKGGDTVLDESYRLARELQAKDFGFNFDPIQLRSGILPSIAAFCNKSVEVELYKLNVYTAGGRFKSHRDTPRGDNHIGTLLIGLPTPFEGGELILTQGKQTTTIDWSTRGRSGDNRILWTFFYADVAHKILPVKSGHRLTVSYHVYSSDTISYTVSAGLQSMDTRSTALYQELRKLLKDPEFLPNGGRLAFGLAHKYPHDGMTKSSKFEAILKGSDNVLHHALTQVGLHHTIKAVYSEDLHEDRIQSFARGKNGVMHYRDRHEESDGGDTSDEEYSEGEPICDLPLYPTDHFSSAYGGCVLLTGDNFHGIYHYQMEYEDEAHYCYLRRTGVRPEWKLVWVTRPQNYVETGDFEAPLGNDAGIVLTYVSAAFVVGIPIAGEGVRGSS